MSSSNKWSELINWFIKKPRTSGALISFILLILTFLLVKMRYQILIENEQKEMTSVLNIVKQNIEQSINNSTTTALTLALTINNEGIPENFNSVSADLLRNNQFVSTVELLPNGIIKYVSPLIGNEKLLGYNVLTTPEQKAEAEKTIHKKTMFFAGPMNLKQGGIGIVGRLPIFKNNKFWGFASIVIPMDNFGKAIGIQEFNSKKYHFHLNKINSKKDSFFTTYQKEIEKKHYIKTSIPQGNWDLFLVNSNLKNSWIPLFPIMLFGFLFSVLLGYLICIFLKKPSELIDITIKQAIHISANEIKFKTFFDEAPVGIAQVDSSTGKFIQINNQFCKSVGYTEEELKQLGFQKITHPDDLKNDLENVQKIIDGKINRYSIQKRYIHKNGKHVWANLTVTKLWKDRQKPTNFIAIFEDITLKKEVELNLKKSYELVTEQNQRLLNFSYIVSHNLRNHTSNIETISNLLSEDNDENEKKDLYQLLKKVSVSLNDTMFNLNEVINIQSNKHINKENIKLNDYILKTLVILNEKIVEIKAIINNNVDPNSMINYNPAYLESILLNFISNAIKYSHPNRQSILTISFHNNQLKISDNGMGIDLQKHGANLFGMYKTFHKNSDSRGIGLFITKNQIEAMNGTVTVESEVGVGTTFTITFNQ